jgi:hypothetical protein
MLGAAAFAQRPSNPNPNPNANPNANQNQNANQNANQNPNQNPNANQNPNLERGTRNSEPEAFEFRGRVSATSSGDPLVHARIGVTADTADVDAAFTDDDGRFALVIRKPTDITVAITKAGYAARRVRVSRAEVMSGKGGEHRLDIGAAITGRIGEHAGTPAVGIAVTARRVDGPDLDAAPKQWSAESDDRGEYRIGGLPPGRYEITAAAAAGSPRLSVELKRGEEIGSVNIGLPPSKPSPSYDERREAVRQAMAFRARFGGRGRVEGHVIGDDGEALGGAVVRLRRLGSLVHEATAGPDGSFVILGVPSGPFRLQGTKDGYVTLEYGQQRATQTGRTLSVREKEPLRGVTLVLPRGAAIAGTVSDEHGEPIEGATVRALQVRYVAGRTVAYRVNGVRERKTDDRGQFRLFGLLPGRYIVAASVDAAVAGVERAASHGYAPSFYPGTAEIGDAWRVEVDVRRDVFGAHVVLTPAPAVRVSGFAFSADGLPLKGTVLLGASQRSRGIVLEPRTASVAPNGSFLLTNVPPGDYVIQALENPRGEKPPEFVSQPLTIAESDAPPITLTTAAGSTLGGEVIIDGYNPRDPATFLISAVPTSVDHAPLLGSGQTLDVSPYGGFSASGLFGPTRFVLEGAPRGWYLKSVRLGGANVTDEPFFFGLSGIWQLSAQLLISTNGANMSGKVVDDAQARVSEYTVVVFPTDRTKWFTHSRYLKFARPAQDDTFEVWGLPPAEYYVAAVESIDATAGAGEWQDPAVLEKLAEDAKRFKVAEGDALDLTLRLVRRN